MKATEVGGVGWQAIS